MRFHGIAITKSAACRESLQIYTISQIQLSQGVCAEIRAIRVSYEVRRYICLLSRAQRKTLRRRKILIRRDLGEKCVMTLGISRVMLQFELANSVGQQHLKNTNEVRQDRVAPRNHGQ